jgi:choline kinase
VQEIKKAIILNAGEGRRLRPLTLNTPKCLLKVGDKTILEGQLSNLSSCGINEVVMVVGYLSEKVMNFAENNFPNLNFKFVRNDVYATTNTLHSLWIALRNWTMILSFLMAM